ncbi:MAG: hypothetical protein NTX03_08540 [Bacteroidetes bacterium]|nr:hypothetical protein [Bacteroidota bacterium]
MCGIHTDISGIQTNTASITISSSGMQTNINVFLIDDCPNQYNYCATIKSTKPTHFITNGIHIYIARN